MLKFVNMTLNSLKLKICKSKTEIRVRVRVRVRVNFLQYKNFKFIRRVFKRKDVYYGKN